MEKPHTIFLKSLNKKVSELTLEERTKYNKLSWSYRQSKNALMFIKKCQHCSNSFSSYDTNRNKYCSSICAEHARSKKVKDYFCSNKEAIKKTSKLYFEKNHEKIKLCNKLWLINNKDTLREYNKKYRIDNKDVIKEKYLNYYTNNKDILKVKRKKYVNKNREKLRLNAKEKYKKDPKEKIRRLVSNAFARMSVNKPVNTERILGCTYEEARLYIESKFLPGMSWCNYGDWHIDHIKPLASIAASNADDLLKINNIYNLQPLWAKDNIIKGAKYDGIDFRQSRQSV
jgi:hypothetical protein